MAEATSLLVDEREAAPESSELTTTFHLAGPSNRAAAVVLAAGSGSRLGAAHNKVFLPLSGRGVVSWSLESFAQVRAVKRFLLVIREEDRALAKETIDREVDNITVEIIVGGDTRQRSELAALRHLAPAIVDDDINMVLIHDGARPLLSPRLIQILIRAAALHQAVFPAIERDDIRRVRPDGTIDRSNPGRLIAAQTQNLLRPATSRRVRASRRGRLHRYRYRLMLGAIQHHAGAMGERRPPQHQDHVSGRSVRRRADLARLRIPCGLTAETGST